MDFSIVWKKLNGSLTEKEEEQLRSWRALSADHENYYQKAKQFYANGSKWPLDKSHEEEAWKALQKKAEVVRPEKTKRIQFSLSMLAACVVVFFVAVVVLRPISKPSTNEGNQVVSLQPGKDRAILKTENGVYDLSSEASKGLQEQGAAQLTQGNTLEYHDTGGSNGKETYNTLITPKGGQFKLILSDGTKVWLNASSSIIYPTRFLGATREVEVKGEAYFEVKEDPSRPFLVKTARQTLRVLGTVFNVTSYEDDAEIVTTLVEGSVAVFDPGVPGVQKVLQPSEQSVWDYHEEKPHVRSVDVHQYIAWKEGWFVFQHTPLIDIVNRLARWYDFTFEFKNESTKQIPFTGKVRRYENLQEVVDLWEKTGDVEFKLERRHMIIK
ncbi:hypothetical protein DN752_05975 [Echinicola strongylocentroti]|uniref:Anti-sigma factor n=2 Tax=Echinicola strongylocentroti TaxID=1795355 RepID=A0A2Z4IG88_9BACT|nr:hypothetical protein DN752_05975 [Echinicola strongylocentroti]